MMSGKIKAFLKSIEYITDAEEYHKRVIEFHSGLVRDPISIMDKAEKKEADAKWREDNADIIKENHRIWRGKNKDKIQKYNADYRAKSK